MLHDGGQSLLDSLIASITAERSSLEAIRSEKDLVQCMERLTGVRFVYTELQTNGTQSGNVCLISGRIIRK